MVGLMSKRFEVLFYGDVINCVRDETGKEYNLHELIDILMNQQDTINKQQAEIERLQKIIDLTQYQLKVQDRILKEVGEWTGIWLDYSLLVALYLQYFMQYKGGWMDKDKKICQLERENRRLRLIVRLQKDIIENYQEIIELNNKVVIE